MTETKVDQLQDWDHSALNRAAQPILHAQKIVLGVTGGISVYKSLELCRLLKKAGADVRVVMTKGALAFVQPLAFQALTGRAPHLELLDSAAEAGMGHIELARWADCVLISPCSANQLAQIAGGFAQDLLGTLILATSAPVLLAPAMNQQMWRNLAVQRNLKIVQELGLQIIQPAVGEQACQDVGPGRAQEPIVIFTCVEHCLAVQFLHGKKILVTAGPTQEAIDTVRFISNHSSGRMGYAIAAAAAQYGGDVTLIAGPSNCKWPERVTGCRIESAQQMQTACLDAGKFDIIIGAAAVADFSPASTASQKLSKQDLGLSIQLHQNPDIIAALADHNPNAFMVGFAAQTHELERLAREKMQRKKLDLICANDVSDPNIGFNSNMNTLTLLSAAKVPLTYGPLEKQLLAQVLMSAIFQLNLTQS